MKDLPITQQVVKDVIYAINRKIEHTKEDCIKLIYSIDLPLTAIEISLGKGLQRVKSTQKEEKKMPEEEGNQQMQMAQESIS